jgi:hypothetical protein
MLLPKPLLRPSNGLSCASFDRFSAATPPCPTDPTLRLVGLVEEELTIGAKSEVATPPKS